MAELPRTLSLVIFTGWVPRNLVRVSDREPVLLSTMVRTMVDSNTGSLSDTRTKFLGTHGVKITKLSVRGNSAMLALSSRSWLGYNYQGRYHTTPLSYEMLEYA